MQRALVPRLRFWLFVSLLVTIPLSKYPSIATPLFNFTSFRLGLYQLLAALFVCVTFIPTIQHLQALYKQNRYAVMSIGVLALIALFGIFGALYKARSGLLIASILLLLLLVLTAWWYVAYELPRERYKQLLTWLLIAGCVYGLISILQFLLAGFFNKSFGTLCQNCTAQIFGFPRVNGLAAEPQFHANALFIFLFAGLGSFYKRRSWLAFASTALSLIGIGLTFSRGAFFATGISVVVFFALLRLQGAVRLKTLALHTGVLLLLGAATVGLFVGAASYRYRGTPDIAYKTFRSLVEQVSVGVIKLPASHSENGSFTPAGFIEESGEERLSAAELALKAWRFNAYTRIFGVGAGNLGPFVIRHINPATPDNLTVYIYYVLLLSELGIIGLAAFLGLLLSALVPFVRSFWRDKNTPLYTAMFSLAIAYILQYWFFGSYINVAYIWLFLGVLLGLSSSTKLKKSAIIREAHEK